MPRSRLAYTYVRFTLERRVNLERSRFLEFTANTSVLTAAALVLLTDSIWPDLAVGLLLTVVFAKSSGTVLSRSWRELQQA